jgi:hypothetical protein
MAGLLVEGDAGLDLSPFDPGRLAVMQGPEVR